MTDSNAGSGEPTIDLSGLTTGPTIIYANTTQELIIVTRDKVHLCLQGNIARMGKRDQWLVPLGVLVPLVLAVTTTTFAKRFGIGGGEWLTIYVMLIIFAVAWLVIALKQRGQSVTVDSIVEELAKNPVTPTRSPTSTGSRESVVGRAGEISPVVPSNQQNDPATAPHSTPKPVRRPVMSLLPGDRVEHDSYGLGIVESVGGTRNDPEARIDFGGDIGKKLLVVRYAPIKKL